MKGRKREKTRSGVTVWIRVRVDTGAAVRVTGVWAYGRLPRAWAAR